MPPTRVIHTADTHIGYTQYHSKEREQDFLDAFNQVVDDAIEEDVEALIHAGDIFHNSNPNSDWLHGLIDSLNRLDDADIPFLGVVGNHEGTQGKEWMDLIEKLGLGTRLDNTPTVIGDTAFYGLDFVPESKRDKLDYQFEQSDATHTALIAHGQFAPLTPGDWDIRTVLSNANISFDATLLGDDHKRQVTEINETVVTYPGSTERTASDQRRERAYNLVEFGADGEYTPPVSIDRCALDTRQFVYLEIELADDEGTAKIRDRLSKRNIDDAIVLVEITGDGSSIQPAPIEEHGIEEGALIVRVYDRREFEDTGSEVSVDFADPDTAARERLSEMSMTEAAYELEQNVREGDVTDSNLTDRTEDRVGEMIDERPDAFEVVEDTDESDVVPDVPDDTDDTDDTDDNDGDGGTPNNSKDAESDAGAVESEPDTTPDAVTNEEDTDTPTDDVSAPDTDETNSDSDTESNPSNTDAPDSSGQVTIGDY